MVGRRSGFGLTGIVLVIGLLYFSGAGTWLWNRTKELDTSCYDLLNEVGFQAGGKVCDGISYAIDKIGDAASAVKSRFSSNSSVEQLEAYRQDLFMRISQTNALAKLASSGDQLESMMREQPQLAGAAATAKDRMRTALDQFVIGQRLKEASPARAVTWFQQSAGQEGGYGVLSQLTLGDMYRTGDGVSANPQAARGYYEKAKYSLQELQNSNAPEAQAMLNNLPTNANDLTRQLNQRIAELR